MDITPAYVLVAMLAALPKSTHKATFETTSIAIAKYANASPLFAGSDGPAKTASILVAVGEFESSLIPNAEGDCVDDKTKQRIPSVDGMCPKGSHPESLCLLQVGRSNLGGFHVTAPEIQGSIDTCIDIGLRLMHASFRICHALPLEHRLGQYAAGGNGCPTSNQDALVKSKHRIARGMWLYGHLPFAAIETP